MGGLGTYPDVYVLLESKTENSGWVTGSTKTCSRHSATAKHKSQARGLASALAHTLSGRRSPLALLLLVHDCRRIGAASVICLSWFACSPVLPIVSVPLPQPSASEHVGAAAAAPTAAELHPLLLLLLLTRDRKLRAFASHLPGQVQHRRD